VSGPSGDEDHEAKAELLLVDLIEVDELRQHRRVTAVLLGRRLADPRVSGKRLDLVLHGELGRDLLGPSEGIVELGQHGDEHARPAEELLELRSAQLPR
jgi:hypothetical protein